MLSLDVSLSELRLSCQQWVSVSVSTSATLGDRGILGHGVCVCVCVCVCVWLFVNPSVHVSFSCNKGKKRRKEGSLCQCLCRIPKQAAFVSVNSMMLDKGSPDGFPFCQRVYPLH